MTSHEDFPLDYLVGGSVMNDSVPSEVFTAGRTLEVALSEIIRYHIGVTLYELSSALLLVTIKQSSAPSTMYCYCVYFSHITFQNDALMAPNFGGQTPTQALHEIQLLEMTASGFLFSR